MASRARLFESPDLTMFSSAGKKTLAETEEPRVAVVIPCYRVRDRILKVIEGVGPEVARIYVVDDACPQGSGDEVEGSCSDSRVMVLRHSVNRGVGGAVVTGYRKAIEEEMTVIVKVDGDGQMDPTAIPRFVTPLLNGSADYTKGNRFFRIEGLRQMPRLRLFGNAILSLLTKLSSGYWDIFDPTNGFTAIHAKVAAVLPLGKLSKRFFFESDMLFRLNTLRATIIEIPTEAAYGDEESNLKIHRVLGVFLFKHAANFLKRIFYNYLLRSFNIASVNLVLGVVLLFFGSYIGITQWYESWRSGVPASSGTVMLASLPVIVGIQLLMAALAYDMRTVTGPPLHKRL